MFLFVFIIHITRLNASITVTTIQVNSALHPSGVAKSSTGFGWGKDGKVTATWWQVTLYDKGTDTTLREVTSQREITCHMGSHSVTCHPAAVTFPPLSQTKLVLDLATPAGCEAELYITRLNSSITNRHQICRLCMTVIAWHGLLCRPGLTYTKQANVNV